MKQIGSKMAILMEGRASAPALPGRPYIGPKAQAAVEELYHSYVRAEARQRGVPMSQVWREIMVQGAIERYNIGGDRAAGEA